MMTSGKVASFKAFDPEEVRADFPALHQEINGVPLVYLDNGATTQKPRAVIDALVHYYECDNSNVHRGAHALSDRATIAFENARKTVASFISSASPEQVIWTRGTTEGVNLVANTWGQTNIGPDDVILVSALEHHSNIVPWQMLAERVGAKVVPIPVSSSGEIDLQAYCSLLNERVRLVAVSHVSNALGSVNPVKEMVDAAHRFSAKVLVDGAQAVSHWPVNVEALGADFYVFSGHKLFGPTGIGVLWGRREILETMPPFHGGGEMIEKVSFAGTTYNGLPYKFEAGTPDIAGAIGLAAAIDYLNQFDREAIAAYEHDLLKYTIEQGEKLGGIQRVGRAENIVGVYSFLLSGAHPADIGMLLDQQGVAVRTGHHCAQPIMDQLNIPGTVRASLSFYNTYDDIDRLFKALEKAKTFLM